MRAAGLIRSAALLGLAALGCGGSGGIAAADAAMDAGASSDMVLAEPGAPDAAPRDVASDTSAADVPGGDGPRTALTCGSSPFPDFDKSCVADGDCALAFHQFNCCGSQLVVGISAHDKAAFEAAEAVCRPTYPGCGCPTAAPQAEDGQSSFETSSFVVACTSGVCTSAVR